MDGRELILKTLLYSNIFHYPLTEEEIYKYLISEKPLDMSSISKILRKVEIPISKKNEYYFIKNENNLLNERTNKQNSNVKKINLAKKIIKTLSVIPTIKFIGISGSLSMKNSDEDDDIDIFVISESKLIWLTRFFLIFTLISKGVYRKKNDKIVKNKICLNMIIDEDNVAFDKKNQDIFIAHEIAQMIPVLDKDSSYKKFIDSNMWVNNFLPNFILNKDDPVIKKNTTIFDKLIVFILKTIKIETIFGAIQKRYMKKHVTHETLRNGYLAFHPFDYRRFVIKSYDLALRKYGLNKN